MQLLDSETEKPDQPVKIDYRRARIGIIGIGMDKTVTPLENLPAVRQIVGRVIAEQSRGARSGRNQMMPETELERQDRNQDDRPSENLRSAGRIGTKLHRSSGTSARFSGENTMIAGRLHPKTEGSKRLGGQAETGFVFGSPLRNPTPPAHFGVPGCSPDFTLLMIRSTMRSLVPAIALSLCLAALSADAKPLIGGPKTIQVGPDGAVPGSVASPMMSQGRYIKGASKVAVPLIAVAFETSAKATVTHGGRDSISKKSLKLKLEGKNALVFNYVKGKNSLHIVSADLAVFTPEHTQGAMIKLNANLAAGSDFVRTCRGIPVATPSSPARNATRPTRSS